MTKKIVQRINWKEQNCKQNQEQRKTKPERFNLTLKSKYLITVCMKRGQKITKVKTT